MFHKKDLVVYKGPDKLYWALKPGMMAEVLAVYDDESPHEICLISEGGLFFVRPDEIELVFST